MIKEQEAGLPPADLCRKHGLSPATFYKLDRPMGHSRIHITCAMVWSD
ncbi:hypothetical protein SAMN06265370_1474 [Puniceibacterium sediminis]|uniref:Transposase n=1 Tax=Puniceibacterium sediminis TaxID=1608407 RepID=A0A238ZXQ2_9RHOB|nr:hypothetical protein SAMN06265370_1474 [Puniceibacterium sediminis]